MVTENYIITENSGGIRAAGTWSVWMRDSPVCMSSHETKREAKAAVKRYDAADLRRANFNPPNRRAPT